MDRSPAGEAPRPISPAGRLDSWKDIATYLNRDVTTVQRWEKREGMPVHRHLHDKMGSVYAFQTELDAWVRGRRPPESQGSGTSSLPLAPLRSGRSTIWTFLKRPTFVLGLSAAGVALAVGASLWLRESEFFWRSPIADAQFQKMTDFDGIEQAAAISRAGREDQHLGGINIRRPAAAALRRCSRV